MKYRIILGVTASVGLLAWPNGSWGDAPVFGEVAPEISAVTWFPSGKEVTLASLRGKFVLLEFWRTGCAHCKKSFPIMDAIDRKYADRVAVIGLTREDPDKAIPFLQEHPVGFPTGLGSPIPQEWHVTKVPYVYLFDPEGRLLWADKPPKIEPVLRNALAGKYPACVIPEEVRGLEDQLARLEERAAKGDTVRVWVDAYRIRKSFPLPHPTYQRIKGLMIEQIKIGLAKLEQAKVLIRQKKLTEARTKLEELMRDYEGALLESDARKVLQSLGNPS